MVKLSEMLKHYELNRNPVALFTFLNNNKLHDLDRYSDAIIDMDPQRSLEDDTEIFIDRLKEMGKVELYLYGVIKDV